MKKVRGVYVAYIPQDPMTSLNPIHSIGDQISEVIVKHQGKSKEEAIKECFYQYCLATYPSYWNIEDFKAYLDITHDLCYIDVIRVY